MSMFPIATYTTTGTDASIVISGIPATFQHLRIHTIMRTNGGSGANIEMRFNADTTGANYFSSYLGTNGGGCFAGNFGGNANIGWSGAGTDTTGSLGSSIVTIQDYANTSKFKTTRAINGVIQTSSTGAGLSGIWAGLWISTAAINSITFSSSSGSFIPGTSIQIYGMQASQMTGA